ncbi:MAG: CCA tRNA nucleotidyltransferase, partial [Verrucomicrobiia bacterium]
PREDPDTLERIALIANRAQELSVADQAPQPLLQGRHLIEKGLTPGPEFSSIIAAAYEAQLNGDFDSLTEAQDWLDSHLKN